MEAVDAAEDDEGLLGQSLRRGLRIERVLARGSFGTVYQGVQLDLGRDVAIKVLHRGWAPSAEVAALFRDEMRALGAIDHRNVIRIHDAGVLADGRAYFVMERLAGVTLQHLREREPVAAARALALVGQLLAGLDAVHGAGRIHADVKPANAMVTIDEAGERLVLIDFGLARAQPTEGAAEAVGGTQSYMAPEQLEHWHLDARSDVFAAALVLVWLLTGWERGSRDAVVPPLDAVDDPAVRVALARALAIDPRDRPSARELRRALLGDAPEVGAPAGPPPPFRHLAPLTERDRARLGGRSRDLELIARAIDPGHVLAVVGRSGIGKTSLLAAGLVPWLRAAGTPVEHLDARATTAWMAPPPSPPGAHHVVIVDQAEAGLGAAQPVLAEVLAVARADVAIVVAVREDLLASVLASHPRLSGGVPLVRLGPLGPDGVDAALTAPLAEHGVTLEPALRTLILDELTAAGRRLGGDAAAAIYPPNVQLVGDALWRALGADERVLTVAHYRRLGGLDALLADDLERRIGELEAGERALARRLLLALVSAAAVGVRLDEVELVAQVGGPDAARRLLERLAERRLLVRRSDGDATTWELVHDSLIPRIEEWLTVQDLERRRVIELLRFHLRQSRPGAPALLGRRALAIAAAAPTVIAELEREWQRRGDAAWTPARLIARSRAVVRRRRLAIAALALAVIAVVAVLGARWQRERTLRAAELARRDRDLGAFELELAAFDLDIADDGGLTVRPVAATALPALGWELRDPDLDDPTSPGALVPSLRHGAVTVDGGARRERGVEARGGPAFLVVTGRGRAGEQCPPSVIWFERLPGYASRSAPPRFRIQVPTCAASRAGMIEIPAGRYLADGLGLPPGGPDDGSLDVPPEHEAAMPAFAIDRTEVTNAAFALFEQDRAAHGVRAPSYPTLLAEMAGPRYPRVSIDRELARAFCHFHGKELPTFAQWQRALRGDADGPWPRRTVPWGDPAAHPTIAIARHGAVEVAAVPDDRSAFGVLGLGGNVSEWLLDLIPSDDELLPLPAVAGGDWDKSTAETLPQFMIAPNMRQARFFSYFHGVRCVRDW